MAEEMRTMSEEDRGIVQWREGAMYVKEQGDPSVEAQLVRKPDGYGSIAVVRDGYRVQEFDGEEEGHCAHIFEDLQSFAEYMNRHYIEVASGSVDILIQEDTVKAIIDTSHRQPETLVCKMVTDPAWDAWMGVFDRELGQRDLQQHIRSWRSTIANHEALLTTLAAMQVTTGQVVRSDIDLTGGTRLSSGEGRQDIQVSIPPTIKASVPCYEGVEEDEAVDAIYELEVLVSVTPTPLSFTLSCPQLEKHERKARRDFAEHLRRLLDDRFLVSIGQASHLTREVKSE
jgi:hypothetical protein